MEQFYKQIDGTFLKVEEAGGWLNESLREDLERDGFRFYASYSGSYFNYDILDLYELSDAIQLIKNNLGDEVARDLDNDIEEFETIGDLQNWLQSELSFYGVRALYKAVNNDKTNTIQARVIAGYVQGEYVFAWADNLEYEFNDAVAREIEEIFFGSFIEINIVDHNGEFVDFFEHTATPYDIDEYMLEKHNATPANVVTSLVLC